MAEEIGNNEMKCLKAHKEAGLIPGNNPQGFFGKLTFTYQKGRIIHIICEESKKLD